MIFFYCYFSQLYAKSSETGLFHTRPMRTRAARFEISWSRSRSNNGFAYSQLKISGDHRLH